MTIATKITSLLLPAALCLTACSEQPAGSDAVTETRMDDIDKIEGTISDDMVATDRLQSGDGIIAGSDTTPKPKTEEVPGEAKSGVTKSGDAKTQVSEPNPGSGPVDTATEQGGQ